MNSLFTSVKWAATSKVWRLFLLLVVLIPVLLMAQPALAQTESFRLTLWLHNGQNNYYNYNTEVRAGEESKFFLDVRNDGNASITNIKLSVEAPEGWTIEIKPSEIDSLSAGSVHTVDVNIKPVGKATKEGRQVTFTAQKNEVQNVKSSFFITVKPAQIWIWVWIAAGVLVVAGFVLIYMRFGRQ